MIKKKLIEHGIAIVLVGIVFVLVYLLIDWNSNPSLIEQQKAIQEYAVLPFIDWNNPAERALFKDVWTIYHADQKTNVDSLLQAIVSSYNSKTAAALQNRDPAERSFLDKVLRFWPMYGKFIIIYIIVLIFSYYAVQTAAVWRFVRMKQQRSSYLLLLYSAIKKHPPMSQLRDYLTLVSQCLKLFGLAMAKGMLYLVLFAPAYVIAYAFKTRFDTDSVLFMILLGTFSNGLLVTYTQKFFAFLVNESRKGYLQTALVKNLFQSYDYRSPDGIPFSNILRLKKEFPGHVFSHIYSNARYQYLPTLKEQASFLITGLIIIEMALNIQNHLCYDLLQNLLYRDYISVLLASFGIFLIVKGTEVISDVLYIKKTEKYENR